MRFVTLMVVCAAAVVADGQLQKNYKDHGEYDLYSDVAKDFGANDSSKALTDLDRWSDKYPDSDFKDDRQMLYVQAYAGNNQFAKAVDAAGALLAKDQPTTGHSASVLRFLYTVASAIPHVLDPNAEQLAIGSRAARFLRDFKTAPEGVAATEWEATRTDLLSVASAALLYTAIVPASRAMKANDCPEAEAAAMKAMNEFSESVQAAWFLASAEVCLAKAEPAKASFALYELARASTLDPAKGMVDGKWQQANVVPYFEKAYVQFHGADPQGLSELKELAMRTPLPPTGFVIKSASEIARDKEADFESKHPEMALWMKIREALSRDDGEHYFGSDLKDSAVPPLVGVLVGANPDCRGTELLVAIVLPHDPPKTQPEILLKLEKALSGRPEHGSEIRWTGVATHFSREPFLLTMDTEYSQIEGVRLSPCQPNSKMKTVPGANQ